MSAGSDVEHSSARKPSPLPHAVYQAASACETQATTSRSEAGTCLLSCWHCSFRLPASVLQLRSCTASASRELCCCSAWASLALTSVSWLCN